MFSSDPKGNHMRRKLIVGLATALGLADTLVVTTPSWASESWHGCHNHNWTSCAGDQSWDYHDYFDGGFGGTYVSCKDGASFATKNKDSGDKKNSGDEHWRYSVHNGKYKGHKDCWKGEN